MPPIPINGLPRGTRYSLREVSRNRVMTPTFGGPETVVQRMGTRSAIEVQVPSVAAGGCGPALIADLLRARYEGGLIAIPEPKMPTHNYGAPLVRGAGQLGTLLVIDGLVPGVAIPKGKWFSLVIAGRRYAYLVAQEVVAEADGHATLPIWPMLRRSPPDNGSVELSEPKMEGFVQNVVERAVRSIGSIEVSFTISERE